MGNNSSQLAVEPSQYVVSDSERSSASGSSRPSSTMLTRSTPMAQPGVASSAPSTWRSVNGPAPTAPVVVIPDSQPKRPPPTMGVFAESPAPVKSKRKRRSSSNINVSMPGPAEAAAGPSKKTAGSKKGKAISSVQSDKENRNTPDQANRPTKKRKTQKDGAATSTPIVPEASPAEQVEQPTVTESAHDNRTPSNLDALAAAASAMERLEEPPTTTAPSTSVSTPSAPSPVLHTPGKLVRPTKSKRKFQDQRMSVGSILSPEHSEDEQDENVVDNTSSSAKATASAAKKKARRSVGRSASRPSSSAPDAECQTPRTVTKSGKFTDDERQILHAAVRRYMSVHGIDQTELNARVQDTERSRSADELWTTIFACLPERDKASLAKIARRTFHNYAKRGQWSAEEEEDLRVAHDRFPGQWTKIGQAISRFPEDCRDRWRNYGTCQANRNQGPWRPAEENMLMNVVAEAAQRIMLSQAGEAEAEGKIPPEFRIDRDINWGLISVQMGESRSRLQCLYKWKKLQKRKAQEMAAEGDPTRSRAASAAPSVIASTEVSETGSVTSATEMSPMPEVPFSPEPDNRPDTWRVKAGKENYKLMLPGDKHEILQAILEFGCTDKGSEINWFAVAVGHKGSRWGTEDRKVVLEKGKLMIVPSAFSHRPYSDLLREIIRQFEKVYDGHLEEFYEGRIWQSKTKNSARKNPLSKIKSEARVVESDDEDGDTVGIEAEAEVQEE